MRFLLPDERRGFLGYCTNVHPIEEPSAMLGALGRWCGPVREELGTSSLALGLWISRKAEDALSKSAAMRNRLAEQLADKRLELVTLNAFPYGDFHATRVKEAVYRPDWSEPERFEYTLSLARILAGLLPEDAPEGTISTLPVCDARVADDERVRASAEALARLAEELRRLADETGRVIRVCLEPEPECVVETSRQAVTFFHETLRPAARRLGVPADAVETHLGVCFDACHQATQFEEPRTAWRTLVDGGVRIAKVQLSCALEVTGATSSEAADVLRPFDEPRFLHQVRRRKDGAVERWRDIGDAFGHVPDGESSDWRVHFHVPLHREAHGGRLGTTAGDLAELVDEIVRSGPLPHLEVETYTWSVLPEGERPTTERELVEGIAKEIRFAEKLFAKAGAGRVRR